MMRFRASLFACAVSIACSKSGGQTSATPAPTTPTLPSAVTLTLSGTVIDQHTARPVSGATLQILDGSKAGTTTTVDAAGAFTFSGLGAGELTIRARATEYVDFETRAMTPQANNRLTILLQPSVRVILGSVTDARTRGVLPNVLVSTFNAPSNVSTRTDSTGNYTLTGASTNTIGLTASATGYLPLSILTRNGGDQRVDFALTRVGETPPLPPVTTPLPPDPPPGGVVIGFDRIGSGLPYDDSGFVVTPVAATWTANTLTGNPTPFVNFVSTLNALTSIGEVRVTAGGTRFRFESIDLYASQSDMSFTFTGIMDGATVYTVTGRRGQLINQFARVANGSASAVIDALVVRLSTTLGPGALTAIGIDNLVVAR